jgi:trehalose 6-phosphate synthase/phosphatase
VAERLLIVSNRLPLTLRRAGDGFREEESAGGLATAMRPVLEGTRGLWLGWPGEAGDVAGPERAAVLESWRERHGYVGIELPRPMASRFYHGYANGTLWPLLHQFPSSLTFDPEDWEAYVEVNRRFCDAVVAAHQPGDLVWVHDYHLMLLPMLLREALPEAVIGFFLHIPFPASDVFRILPHREELLQGLLGADLIAFQTHADLQHFRSSLLRILGRGSRMDRVAVDDRFARLEALPIGIAPWEFTGLLDSDPAARSTLEEVRKRHAGQRVLLAVDRLDYTKGIPQRLRAFRRLLRRAAELRGRVVLIQVAVPTRERVARYRELQVEVNQLVGEINGEFATPGWTPVVYIRRGLPRPELAALYAAADVGWVTPLRDGMNLVAKEYVACQRGGEGVLVLSEFAGAAAEMGEAFLVNPYDEDRTAATLERVLALPADERRERMEALLARILRNHSLAWAERFLAQLREAAGSRAQTRPTGHSPFPLRALLDAYRASRHRLLFLDYDGTLVPYASRPRDAVPPRALCELLARLAGRAENRVALVSGRPRAVLQRWFGGVPGLWLAAEHGATYRAAGRDDWETVGPMLPVDWKERVRPVLEHFVDRTPGSLLEEKEYSLVWHYRMSDPEFGDWLANELVATLEELLAETELRAVRGQMSVEVKLAWANKGEVVGRLEGDGFTPDLRLALGDDRTDEDLFERLPEDAWTIHVGEGPSRARYLLPGPGAVIRLLEALAGATS